MLLKETEQSEDLVMGERVRGELTKGEVKLVRLDVTAIAFFCFVFGPCAAWSCSFFFLSWRLPKICLPLYLGFLGVFLFYLLFGLLPICCRSSRDVSTKTYDQNSI